MFSLAFFWFSDYVNKILAGPTVAAVVSVITGVIVSVAVMFAVHRTRALA